MESVWVRTHFSIEKRVKEKAARAWLRAEVVLGALMLCSLLKNVN